MGFISKLFGLHVRCDRCGSNDAKDGFSGVRCQNPGCTAFGKPSVQEVSATQPVEFVYDPTELLPVSRHYHSVTFARTMTINYTNAFGQSRTFECDPTSLETRNQRISVRVLPTGGRIALAPERIDNWNDVEQALRDLEPDFSDPVVIEYENYRGEHKTFRAARQQAKVAGNRVSVCVAPEKIHVSLKIDRIQNWASVKSQLE